MSSPHSASDSSLRCYELTLRFLEDIVLPARFLSVLTPSPRRPNCLALVTLATIILLTLYAKGRTLCGVDPLLLSYTLEMSPSHGWRGGVDRLMP